MTNTCFILLAATESPDTLNLICKLKLLSLKNLSLLCLSHKLGCEYLDFCGLPCCSELRVKQPYKAPAHHVFSTHRPTLEAQGTHLLLIITVGERQESLLGMG